MGPSVAAGKIYLKNAKCRASCDSGQCVSSGSLSAAAKVFGFPGGRCRCVDFKGRVEYRPQKLHFSAIINRGKVEARVAKKYC